MEFKGTRDRHDVIRLDHSLPVASRMSKGRDKMITFVINSSGA